MHLHTQFLVHDLSLCILSQYYHIYLYHIPLGPSESRLTERGLEQAMQLGNFFAPKRDSVDNIGALFSSDLFRATQTAGYVAATTGLPVQTLKGLRERHLGIVQGLTDSEAKVKCPKAFEQMRSGQSIEGGGEDDADFKVRVAETVREIAARYPGGRCVRSTAVQCCVYLIFYFLFWMEVRDHSCMEKRFFIFSSIQTFCRSQKKKKCVYLVLFVCVSYRSFPFESAGSA